MLDQNEIKEGVKEYYGETLKTSSDLQTNACCDPYSMPNHIKTALSEISDEVVSKYYGCGLTIPTELNGLSVLDLGSGAGRDCFLLSKLVGENGKVTGVDMTDAQLEVANRNISYHTEKFGYKKPNVEFLKGDLEKLDELGLKDGSYDAVVSNCVINLIPNKESVLANTHRLLREGGELYFSDVYCNRRIPQELVNDKELYGECLSGAMYWNDFENLSKKVGFSDPRIVESKPITIENPRLQQMLAGFEFYSVVYRLFKISELEPHCEEYGQAIEYKGGMDEAPNAFMLDGHHVFQKGKIESVCGNSYNMIHKTRFKKYFNFYGDFSTHYGIYKDCGMNIPYSNIDSTAKNNSTNNDTNTDTAAGGCC